MPFFRSLKREVYGEKALNDDEISVLVDLTQQVFLTVERELKLIGFWESIAARNKLKADILTTLIQPTYNKLPNLISNRTQIMSRIMEIAEKITMSFYTRDNYGTGLHDQAICQA